MSRRYILRLDDASDYMDRDKWEIMETLLDSYGIRPLVGIIPYNQDPSMVEMYEQNPCFWETVKRWQNKGWSLAMHGYNHRYVTGNGGVNPVNLKSEFAGLPYAEQARKISEGIEILKNHGVNPGVFFAPSHTFDKNTIKALKDCSDIRIISDTIANKPYHKYGMTFVPQQSGSVRKLPFHTTTFCYHPNTMDTAAFDKLEVFLQQNHILFTEFPMELVTRKKSIYDRALKTLYFTLKKIR